MTRKAVEETAARILKLYRDRFEGNGRQGAGTETAGKKAGKKS